MEKNEKLSAMDILRDLKMTHETSGEFILPDYLPPVRKLLYARAQVLPEGAYLRECNNGGCAVDFAGTVVYTILWADEDGGVYSVCLSSDYDDSAVITSPCPIQACDVETEAENVNCRVMAPRKVSLRCRMNSKIRALCECSTLPVINGGAEISSLEVRRDTAVSARLYRGVAQDLHAETNILSSETGIFAESEEGRRTVGCDGAVSISDVKYVGGSALRCRGDIILRCSVFDATNGFSNIVRKIPVDELIELDKMPEDTDLLCRGYGRCINAEIAEGEEGITVKLEYELMAEAVQNEEITLMKDAYSVNAPSACEYKDMQIFKTLCCTNTKVSVNERALLREMQGKDGAVCDITASAVIDDVAQKGNRICVTGTCSGNALIRWNTGEGTVDGEYSNEEFSVPLKCEIDCANVKADDTDKLIWYGSVDIIGAAGRVDANRAPEEALCVDMEAAVSVTAMLSETKKILSQVAVEGEYPHKKESAFVLYYPDQNETMWDVAKRYHVPCAALAKQNECDVDAVIGNVVII